MNPSIRTDRVRALLRLLGELRERVRAGEEVFPNFGDCLSRLLGADVVIAVRGSQDARVGITLLDLKTIGLSQNDAAHARRVYLDERGFLVNVAAAKVLDRRERGDFVVKLRRELVGDDVWYRSEFVVVHRRAWGLDDAIYGSHITASGRLIGFGSARAWGARPFTEEDCALAAIFWERWAAELAAPEAALSRRQREILRLLLEGQSTKAIASKLDLSIHTVNEYIRAVYQAKSVRSRGELLALELQGQRKTVA
jgi:DNA-binding CsgD family transcriptional regulator